LSTKQPPKPTRSDWVSHMTTFETFDVVAACNPSRLLDLSQMFVSE